MPNRGFLLRNGFFNAATVVIVSACLLLSYRMIYRSLPLEEIGVWSLLMAGVALGRSAELGLGAAMVREVARCWGMGRRDLAATTILVGSSASLVLLGCVLAVLAPLLHVLLERLLASEHDFALAQSIMPAALGIVAASTVAAILQGGLEGTGRIELKSAVVCGSAILNLLLVSLFLADQTVARLAYLQLCTALASAAASAAAVAFVFGRAMKRVRWPTRRRLRDVLTFSLTLQGVALARSALDPATKFMLGHFGDLTSVAHYELANRMMAQVRSLTSALGQGLVPAIARVGHSHQDALVYHTRLRKEFAFLGLVSHAAILIVLPWLSSFTLGEPNADFLLYAWLLAVGFALNTACVAGYFILLGLGRVGDNLMAMLVAATVTLAGGAALGAALGGPGVVLGWSLALVAGGLTTECLVRRHLGSPREAAWTAPVVLAAASAGITAPIASGSYILNLDPAHPLTVTAIGLGLSGLGFATWLHGRQSEVFQRGLAIVPRLRRHRPVSQGARVPETTLT